MAPFPRVRRLAPVLVAALLAACAETAPGPEAAPVVITAPPPPPPAPRPLPPSRGHFKIGPPYRQNGILYTPRPEWDYHEVGEASWYGPGFRGKRTANGERYDPNALTAAHTTLPLPSVVRVTNLRNGRSVVVKVNDRGPFLVGRIIDVSAKAARLLGFHRTGTAMVRVQLLEEESRQAAREAGAPRTFWQRPQLAGPQPMS